MLFGRPPPPPSRLCLFLAVCPPERMFLPLGAVFAGCCVGELLAFCPALVAPAPLFFNPDSLIVERVATRNSGQRGSFFPNAPCGCASRRCSPPFSLNHHLTIA